MAETALPIVFGCITDPIKKYVYVFIKTQISYAFKCDSKVEKLQAEIQQLQNNRDRLQDSVVADIRNGKQIYPNVTEWLSTVEKDIEEADKLIKGKEDAMKEKCFVGFCPNLKTRYQLGKSAEKKASAIVKLRNVEGLDSISFPPPLQQIVPPSVYSREGLPSRVLLLKSIMDALRDSNLNMIGVHGMGGVGKTTLAKEVHGKAVADKSLFDDVIMVAVSQMLELRRIQDEIAGFLGLKFEAEALSVRASQLKRRLENSKVLIILDDLWQKIDLNDIGIPSGELYKGPCKIMLTSRSIDLLSSAQKLFPLEALNEDEAWMLFELCVSQAKDPQFHAIATKIAKKCAGLPLLIQLVATELQNKESYAWNDKLNQLSSLGDEEIYERVYKVLESSYDNLLGEEIKSFFLLFALFGQSNIPIHYLLAHSMGLGLFKQISDFEGARNRVLTLIDKLKAKNLLLDGDIDGCVKMHHVIRDMALRIASRVQHAFIGSGSSYGPNSNCTKISFPYSDVRELPEGLDCPQAELFLLFTEDLCLEIPDSFFKGINKLKVVDLTGMRLMPLPSSIGSLTNLQTLCLHRCRLDDVAMVGKLKLLESLSFANSKFVELPREIEALTRLKLLDLRNCSDLEKIPENVFSKLVSLEELYMLNSFVRWNSKGNVSLVELDSLSCLTTLEIEIRDSKLIPQSCNFFDGLKSYKISIGDEWGNWQGENDKRSRTLKLKLDAGIHLVDGIKLLLKGAEDLYLSGGRGVCHVLDLDREGFTQLKHLHIKNDFGIQHLIRASCCVAFPVLESLDLVNLWSLETFCYGQLEMGSFGELRILKISGCDKLKRLFPLSSAKCLRKLRKMEVESCGNMEAIVGQEGEDEHSNNEVIEFSQLSSLKLKNLQHLKGFCKINERFESEKLLFNEMVSFPNLTSLEVKNCKCLKNVLTASMIKCLVQLKKLVIIDCELVEEIIQSKKDEEIEQESIDVILFPNLDYLQLRNLPNAKTFCFGYSIEFPLLREMKMEKCRAMKNFAVSKSSSSNESDDQEYYFFNEMVSFPNLTSLEVYNCKCLKNVFTASMIKCLVQLKKLVIIDCELVEEIIQSKKDEEIEQESIDGIVFPNLDYLELKKLPNAKTFSFGYSIEFPLLREMKMEKCRAMKNFAVSKSSSSDEEYLFNEMVTFSNLEILEVWHMNKFKYLWDKQFRTADDCDSFSKLRSLKIFSCSRLSVVFPSNACRRFQRLETLDVSHCDGVEEIYEYKGIDFKEAFSLRDLQIQVLPSLKKIWSKDPCGAFTFENLQSVDVSDCSDLKYVFPASIASGLQKLQKLRINDCKKVEVIIAKEIKDERSDHSFQFPELTTLELKELNKMRSLYEEGHTFQFIANNLEQLRIDEQGFNAIQQQSRRFSVDFLYKLKKITLVKWKQESSIPFVFGFLRRLKSLEMLEFNWCSLEEILLESDNERPIEDQEQLHHLITLKHLKLIGVSKLKHIITIKKKDSQLINHILQHLHTLNVICCDDLMNIAPSSTSFQNLTTLCVQGCHNMKNLLTASTAKTMVQLNELEVKDCWKIEEIVTKEDGDHDTEHPDMIIFKKLKRLQLNNLPNFNNFCSKKYPFNFPQLEQVTIKQCLRMKIFYDGELSTPMLRGILYEDEQQWDGNLNDTISSQLREWVGGNVEEGRVFQNVESLQVVKDAFCSKAILANQMQFLKRLREITVRDCESVQVVFDLEGLPAEDDGHAWLLPQLNRLELINLPLLSQLCNKAPGGILHLSKLKVLKIENCNKLEYAFTWSMASCLFQLGSIQLRNCEKMETIIKEEEAVAQVIHFGSLVSIILERLPKFSSIYSGSGDLVCPSLNNITIKECPIIKSFISRLVREEHADGKEDHNSFHFSHKFVPNLEKLEIDDTSLRALHQCGNFSLEFFSKLENVTLTSFKKESIIPSLLGSLRRLWSSEMVYLRSCSFQEISVLDDEIRAIGEEEHHHLRLKHLNLSYVRNLKHMMIKKDYSLLNLILQNLQTLNVQSCYDMINITPCSASFQNLTTLHVENCNNMTSLVTASTAKTMVQLMKLKVSYCRNMKEVVAPDDAEDCIEPIDEIIFNKLKSLKLVCLSSLNSFCSGNYAFSFPLLEEVKVERCSRMKFFCGGDLSTPKLRGIECEDERQCEGNLNATIACQLKEWVGGHFEDGRLFPNVESLQVVEDAFCSKAILANGMQLLNKLTKITVKDCRSVQVVFDLEGLSNEDGHAWQLNELELTNLPILTQLCNEAPKGILDFNNLKVLKIDRCSRLEYVFTGSMASCLVHLQKIELKNCEMMETIIKEEEAVRDAAVLGSLESIVVECLPKFSSIYSGSHDLECPSLNKITVRECPSIKSFISRLTREDTDGKEEHNYIHFTHKVFPELKELSLDIKSITAILQFEFPTNFFSNVKKLEFVHCSATTNSYVPLLLRFLTRLPNAAELGVCNSSVEELFKFEGLSSSLEEAVTTAMPQLTTLNLKNLVCLKQIIWWENSQFLASSFQNLTTLVVVHCNELRYLITSSVAKSMVQLETLRVESCKMLTEILEDRNDGTTDQEIVFAKMKTLDLEYLDSLRSFSSGHCTFKFPCLEQVYVWKCPNLRVFCPGNLRTPMLERVLDHYSLSIYWEGNLNNTIEEIYKKMVGFEYINDVKLSLFPILKDKWGGQFPFKYFRNLERLVVDDCAVISNAISSHLLQHLMKLRVLIVEKCHLVEQVFDSEGLNDIQYVIRRMNNLKELQLIDLPKLTHVWSKDPQQILSFENLQLLKVHNCCSLTFIFDLSTASSLLNLQHLEVKNYSLVEHIVAQGEDEKMQKHQTIFPSLQSMNLQNLTNLLSFYSASGFLECPSMKMIEVVECPNMELFASSSSNEQDSCMIAEEKKESISNEIVFLGNKIGIPGLEELKVEWSSFKGILYGDNQPKFLHGLNCIELTGFQGEEHAILPSNFLQQFPKLEKLAISDSSIEEVNLQELSFLKSEDAESAALFTKLKLSNLSKLKHLVHDDSQLVLLFQNLEDLEAVECSRLEILVPSTVAFQNLTNLQVSKCDGMINLMTASTARSLVQLRRMNVKDCKMMREIVANIASEGVEYEIRFSQLEYLGLDGLTCLTSFSSGNFDFHFPSLKEFLVTGCPDMKIFADQVPTAPKLWKVRTGKQEYDWEWEGSLNPTIQALFLGKSAQTSSSLQIS